MYAASRSGQCNDNMRIDKGGQLTDDPIITLIANLPEYTARADWFNTPLPDGFRLSQRSTRS
jgi:hypothetical protein